MPKKLINITTAHLSALYKIVMIDSLSILTIYHRGLHDYTILIIMMDRLSTLINYCGRLLVHAELLWWTALSTLINYHGGPLVCTILITMDCTHIHYHGGLLVCTILIIMMGPHCPHSYKLSWQTACLHCINYYDGLLLHTHINYCDGPLVCTILILWWTTCPRSYKLSRRTACPHYINYCDGLLVYYFKVCDVEILNM